MASRWRQRGWSGRLLPIACISLATVPLRGPVPARPAIDDVASRSGTLVVRSAPDSSPWRLPLGDRADIVRRFEGPAAPWAPGHRGVDLRGATGQVVSSPADAVVTYAGVVAGRSVVVLTHAAGIRTSLEPVQAVVPVGTQVAAGDAVGRLTDEPSHCTPVCLHWGVRRGSTYLDPLVLLGVRTAILLPVAG